MQSEPGPAHGPPLTIRRETPDQPGVTRLLLLADERSAALYPAESRHGLDMPALLAAGVRFTVARLGDQVVGCGGYVLMQDGTAELKRLFVLPDARGRGIGQRIVERCEQDAAMEAAWLMRLETGVKSAEALGLYRRLGYAERGAFGAYQPDPLSVFMEKPLTPAAVSQGYRPA